MNENGAREPIHRSKSGVIRRLSDPQMLALLKATVVKGASGLILSSETPPRLRIGESLVLESDRVLRPDDTHRLLFALLSDFERDRFEQTNDLDLGLDVEGLGRFRLNAFRQRGQVGLVLQSIPSRIPSVTELGLPPAVSELAELKRGLVLVTGPKGSGKTTLLAALIHKINSERQAHIVTIEDPIEFVHKNLKSVVEQREIGADTDSYAAALRAVLRQCPDVILVGEMKDPETIKASVTIAEAGHLVFSTLLTRTATQSVARIIDAIPQDSRAQIRAQLATTLKGIVCQTLIPSTDGTRRVVAREILVMTNPIAAMIREGTDHFIASAIQSGGPLGMVTMEASINTLLQQRVVDEKVAESVLGLIRPSPEGPRISPEDLLPPLESETQRARGSFFHNFLLFGSMASLFLGGVLELWKIQPAGMRPEHGYGVATVFFLLYILDLLRMVRQ